MISRLSHDVLSPTKDRHASNGRPEMHGARAKGKETKQQSDQRMKRHQFPQKLRREEQPQNRRGAKRPHRELGKHEHDHQRQVRMFRLVLERSRPGRRLSGRVLRVRY